MLLPLRRDVSNTGRRSNQLVDRRTRLPTAAQRTQCKVFNGVGILCALPRRSSKSYPPVLRTSPRRHRAAAPQPNCKLERRVHHEGREDHEEKKKIMSLLSELRALRALRGKICSFRKFSQAAQICSHSTIEQSLALTMRAER